MNRAPRRQIGDQALPATPRTFARALGLTALLCAPVLYAQDARLVLAFGAEPGAALPHAYDYGAPPAASTTYTMRVPLFDPQVLPIFVDGEMTIDSATKIVQRVRLERAMKTLADCNAAKSVLDVKIAAAMPTPYTGPNPAWQYQNEKASAVGGAQCRTERYLPYVILTVDLSVPPAP